MTDQPDHQPHDAPPSEPTSTPSRWQRMRPRGRLGQVAAILVSAAAGVVIVGAIFFAGFAVGSEGGDGHHGHGGDGYSHGDGKHHRGADEADGPGHDGPR